MLLTVAAKPNTLTATKFTFVVPGNQIWRVRSVVATVNTGTGGQPNRGYTLQYTDGTTVVAQVGADDGGTQPASGTITWANAPGGISAAGSTFSSIAPLADTNLRPGYNIIGTIVNSVAGDAWQTAIVWYSYVDSR